MWRDGVVVRASDLQPRGHRFETSSPGRSAPRNNYGQVVHTHVPLFTKQHTGASWELNTLAPCPRHETLCTTTPRHDIGGHCGTCQ